MRPHGGRWFIRPLQGRRCFLSFFSGTWNSFGICFDRITDHCSYILRNPVGAFCFFFISFRNVVSLRDLDWVDFHLSQQHHFFHLYNSKFFTKESERILMLQNIKHNYPRPQRGRISATTKVVVDSSPTGSGTLPFFFFWNVEFLRNLF